MLPLLPLLAVSACLPSPCPSRSLLLQNVVFGLTTRSRGEQRISSGQISAMRLSSVWVRAVSLPRVRRISVHKLG
ncbi:uncharacterized protein BDZ83DRAFT_796502 [Colletotrichum acutatum]|uniref:Secreted protein n=1 Tax=Glomerella acutata TaxID=27357 RepID=A0AAD8UDM3_GLOAC|nr:uncharacterized protein BDZ83DRAFT_796502 [Colletotrichum acutatum]KAK1713305.1 hypothetical protein BDZ83DRAFT_796502 [Colletotrichum acutatum]